MDTARIARAHIIWTSIALVLILIASCLTYVFMSVNKVHGCQTFSTLNVSAIENMSSRDQWMLKVASQFEDYLIWEDVWHGHNHTRILDPTNKLMDIRDKGIYLVYIQVNFQLLNQIIGKNVELKILVYFSSDGKEELFAAAHDNLVVNESAQDAKLSTFLLMKMLPKTQISVKVIPSHFVISQPQPFSSFITIIKWADNW